MVNNKVLTSVEYGALWTTYQKKTMILCFLQYFIEKSEEPKAKDLMKGLHDKLNTKVNEIRNILEGAGAIIPNGFTNDDVYLDAPVLFEQGFDIMFSRILKEISMGMYVLHTTISYRPDIINLYRSLTELTQKYYYYFTEYLLDHKLMLNPPVINMPHSKSYIEDPSYMKGTNIFGNKRNFNVVEYGLLYHSLESNVLGMQLMKGFAQTSANSDVKEYFQKGYELAKKIYLETEEMLLNSDILTPSIVSRKVTSSTTAPFSDKLMMFCTYLLNGFSIGGQGFGAVFCLRNDAILQSGVFAKDVLSFGLKGARIMMERGWLEEPPSMNN
ncbi:DUF3231 domain-containing protein [Niallia circulans]|jgi:hypothetical protein|uniref:DUF3231 family protein n=3 Tax=Niallia TaxID=2837506 RepID=A0A0J1KI70_NIACI|nr:DUF3231 family protein [Niallia circulans]KLV16240.1 hypothetical protein ABW02_25315 [Niallia circulans]MED5103241.1 DUF3231 family protein [Niallia circulans]PAD23622.1 DUF3231 domain-containing protein [Niallia circulans]PAD87457.1 DUF3231 domain-containing protein [Niallia circulans]